MPSLGNYLEKKEREMRNTLTKKEIVDIKEDYEPNIKVWKCKSCGNELPSCPYDYYEFPDGHLEDLDCCLMCGSKDLPEGYL